MIMIWAATSAMIWITHVKKSHHYVIFTPPVKKEVISLSITIIGMKIILHKLHGCGFKILNVDTDITATQEVPFRMVP